MELPSHVVGDWTLDIGVSGIPDHYAIGTLSGFGIFIYKYILDRKGIKFIKSNREKNTSTSSSPNLQAKCGKTVSSLLAFLDTKLNTTTPKKFWHLQNFIHKITNAPVFISIYEKFGIGYFCLVKKNLDSWDPLRVKGVLRAGWRLSKRSPLTIGPNI